MTLLNTIGGFFKGAGKGLVSGLNTINGYLKPYALPLLTTINPMAGVAYGASSTALDWLDDGLNDTGKSSMTQVKNLFKDPSLQNMIEAGKSLYGDYKGIAALMPAEPDKKSVMAGGNRYTIPNTMASSMWFDEFKRVEDANVQRYGPRPGFHNLVPSSARNAVPYVAPAVAAAAAAPEAPMSMIDRMSNLFKKRSKKQ